MSSGAVFFLVLFVSIGGMVALYLAIEGETRDLPRMDRDDAERQAQAEGKKYNRK
nr:hypothetical protein [Haloferax larsenii]